MSVISVMSVPSIFLMVLVSSVVSIWILPTLMVMIVVTVLRIE